VRSEILDHAARVLGAEPARTMNARTLYARVAAALGGRFGYDEFMAAMAGRPDLFVVSPERTPLLDAWAEHDLARYRHALAAAGLARGAAISLADAPPASDSVETVCSDPLIDTLRDAHQAVAILIRTGGDTAPPGLCFDAVAGLEQLQRVCLP
jgi:hypothetical protein